MQAAGDPRGYYRVLGVARGASLDELRQAFRERAKRYHPDQGGAEADDETFRRLREAYDVLRDPRRRMQYDAMGLEAEREDAGSGRGGGRRRAGSASRSASPWRIGPMRLAQGAAAMAALLLFVLVVVLGLLSSARQQLEEREMLIAQLYDRLDEALADEADARARYRDASFRRLEEMVEAGGGRLAATGAFVFAAELGFAPGQAELDAGLERELERAIVGLADHIREVPPDRDWRIVIEAQAGRAAAPGGVAVDAWETTLLRLAGVVDRLVAAGLPSERLAVRFVGGMAAPGTVGMAEAGPPGSPVTAAATAGIVEIKLLCCLR